MYARAIESIKEHGFIDPVTAREVGTDLEIVDGEHRWRGAIDLSLALIPVFNLGPLSDQAAKKLTILLNDLHGTPDQQKLAVLLKDLASNESLEELTKSLPFTPESLRGMIGLEDFAWPDSLKPSPAPAGQEKKETFIERTYRMPRDAAAVLDEALSKAKDGEEIADWQALERLAAEFLAG